jgi:hypothetical protein
MKSNVISAFLILALCAYAVPAENSSNESPACCRALSADPDAHTCPDRAFALFLPRTIEPHSFLLTIEHRTSAPAFDHPFRDFLGFDNGGLKIGLGFRWSPVNNFDVGLRRFNNVFEPWDTYEFDGRYQLLKERDHLIDGAIIGGATWFYQYTGQDASGFYGAALAGRSFWDQSYLSAGIMFHTKSTYMTKTVADKSASVAVPLSLIVSTPIGLSVLAESFIPLSGYYSAGKPSLTAGLKYATYHHTFSLLFSTTQYTSFDGAVTGSDHSNKPGAGFMITRKFGG